MPRNITFVPEDKLLLAMELFWKKGYTNTSLNDLQKVMGISRQSMYNTFGDKKTLFMKALDIYEEKIRKDMGRLITHPDASMKEIKEYFLHTIKDTNFDETRRSCFMANSAMELSILDQEIMERTKEFIDYNRSVLINALDNAVEKGEIPPTLEIERLADVLITFMHGLGVMAKFGRTNDNLRDIFESFSVITGI